MAKKILTLVLIFSFTAQLCWAIDHVKIVKISGKVKVRRGVEETWDNAVKGMILKPIDTILTGENSEVVLEISDNQTFKLGSHAVLDIGDLRSISEKELFLFLMSTKIGKIAPRDEKTPLRVGNVSVVHGEDKSETNQKINDSSDPDRWKKETNGAKALHHQKYYTNTIVKLHKILTKYTSISDCGEIYFYLGKSFEALNKPGQAIDAYKLVIQRHKEQGCENKTWVDGAKEAIERLKP